MIQAGMGSRNCVGIRCHELLQVHRRQPGPARLSPYERGSQHYLDLAHSLGWKCTRNFKIQGLEEMAQPQNLPSLFRSGQRHRSTLQINCCLPGFSAACVASEWTVGPPLWWLAGFASPVTGKQVTLMAFFSSCPFLLPGHLYVQLWKDNLMLTKLIAFAK